MGAADPLHDYERTVHTVLRVLQSADPLQLAAPAEACEYEEEAREIARRLIREPPSDSVEVGRIIQEVVVEYFGERLGDQALASLGADLFAAHSRHTG